MMNISQVGEHISMVSILKFWAILNNATMNILLYSFDQLIYSFLMGKHL